jgi:hypothetical protein
MKISADRYASFLVAISKVRPLKQKNQAAAMLQNAWQLALGAEETLRRGNSHKGILLRQSCS